MRTRRNPNLAKTLIYTLKFQAKFWKQITFQYAQPLPDAVIGNGPAAVRKQFFQIGKYLLLHDTDRLSADRFDQCVAGIHQSSDLDSPSSATERCTAKITLSPSAFPEHEQEQKT